MLALPSGMRFSRTNFAFDANLSHRSAPRRNGSRWPPLRLRPQFFDRHSQRPKSICVVRRPIVQRFAFECTTLFVLFVAIMSQRLQAVGTFLPVTPGPAKDRSRRRYHVFDAELPSALHRSEDFPEQFFNAAAST